MTAFSLFPRRSRHHQRGISLIEALVAMAVMAIGMLGLVGVQSTLRGNSDLAKQRAEAVRLAQQGIERYRAYVVMGPATAGQTTYADFDFDSAPQTEQIPATSVVGNADYTRVTRTKNLRGELGAPARALTVDVTWTDRAGQAQAVQLVTVIAGVAPVLSATMNVAAGSSNYQTPQGRNRAIPPGAKLFPGTGTSGFIPPGSSGVGWRFDNTTAVITLCTTAQTSNLLLQLSDLNCSSNQKAILVSGFVRFALPSTPAQPTVQEAIDANSAVEPGVAVSFIQNHTTTPVTRACFNSVVATLTPTLENYIEYYCAVPTTQVPPAPPAGVTGRVQLNYPSAATLATSVTADNDPAHRRVCRYQAEPDYLTVVDPQVNKNFLVIQAGDGVTNSTPFSCTLGVTTPVARQYTWPHQPLP